ncbi:hypothetical protein BJ994_002281 [Arthrobacter pigmenti]|uniref:Uncharacterized protein n=1 Tax=Arthrobacter pigmenti TaxID=271432 RepID=A0A846RU82_9MICC|nr:hypothetical protein [Arthrobacter pigmenti]NJC23205.1 hypothetical protein [Arthrobacter pigmenti]
MNASPIAVTALLIVSLLIYLSLRAFALTPRSDRTGVETARTHAFWTGLIGYLASSGMALYSAASFDADVAGADYFPRILFAFLVPALSFSMIHILGQFTWPKHRRPVRRAALNVRRMSDFLPTRLTALTGLVFVFSVVVCVAVVAVEPVGTALIENPGAESYLQAGRVDGGTYSAAMGLTLAACALGVVSALLVITRRRPLETLSEANDAVLRRISVNRLLRTGGIFFLAISSAALEFARWPESAWGTDYELLHNVLRLLAVACIFVFALWRPPSMHSEEPVTVELDSSGSDESPTREVAHFSALIAATVTLIASTVAVNLIPVAGGATWLRDHLFPPQFAAAGVVYLLFSTVARIRTQPQGRTPLPIRGASSPAAATVATGGLGLLVIALAGVLVFEPRANELLLAINPPASGLPAPFPGLAHLMPTVLSLIALIGALCFWLRSSSQVRLNSRRSNHQALCVFGASCLAMTSAVIWSAGQRWSVSGGTTANLEQYSEAVMGLMNFCVPLWIVAALAAFIPAPVSRGRLEQEPAVIRDAA